jgi:hypothetical protein
VGAFAWIGRFALGGSLALLVMPACSLGQGTGCVAGTLDVPDCWSGAFDLHPDFFAAMPTNSAALQIRIQNGIDYETFSDGLIILVDDVGEVRGTPLSDGTPRPGLLGQPLVVSLPPGVSPPGVPLKASPVRSLVHASLYPERTCRTQNVALYAVDAVSLEADGTCNRPDGGSPPLRCDAPVTVAEGGAAASEADAGSVAACTAFQSTRVSGGVATSMIRFTSLFDGDVTASNAQQRLTDADFDFYFADPRDVCPGGLGPPPRCRGRLQGHVHFYFQRGRPAQPFP